MYLRQPLGWLPETLLHPTPTQASILLTGICRGAQPCFLALVWEGDREEQANMQEHWPGPDTCQLQPWEVGVVPTLEMVGGG